jgi:uncharacterized membrane protein YebE (DUF533 family)
MDPKSSSPGPLVWIAAVAAIAALAYFGWRSNQSRPTALPANTPAEASPSAPQPAPPTDTPPTPSGVLEG